MKTMNVNVNWQKEGFRRVAFANTDGGTILLGVKEHRDSFTVNGLTDRQIAKYQKNFWSVLNDRNKISKNILLNHHVKIVECEGKNYWK